MVGLSTKELIRAVDRQRLPGIPPASPAHASRQGDPHEPS